jgi:hypothetical protein
VDFLAIGRGWTKAGTVSGAVWPGTGRHPLLHCNSGWIGPLTQASESDQSDLSDAGRAGSLLPAIVVAPGDHVAAAKLDLPVRLFLAGVDGWSDGRQSVPPDLVQLCAVGVLTLSADGVALADRHALLWHDRFGTEPPPRLDIDRKDKAPLLAILRWLCDRLARDQGRVATRAVDLNRQLALLRQQQDATQSAFQRLENFAYQHQLTQRQLDATFAPVVGSPDLVLAPGSLLAQRLPGGSVGLSDVSLRIADGAMPRSGALECWLESPDLGRELARWIIPVDRITPGWLRLALDVALDADPVSLVLHLHWTGNADLHIESAMAHPDVRFRPVLDGIARGCVPAMQLWHHLAGSRAPMSAMGVRPLGSGKPNMGGVIRRVEAQELARAVNLDTLKTDVPLFEGGDALLVHVLPDRMSCAILAVAQAGARQISATICTRHPDGPPVEYAIAVLPDQLRPLKARQEPKFPANLHSGWVRTRAMQPLQATLILPEPLESSADIYLMTRLPAGHRSDAFGWSTFSDLTVRY